MNSRASRKRDLRIKNQAGQLVWRLAIVAAALLTTSKALEYIWQGEQRIRKQVQEEQEAKHKFFERSLETIAEAETSVHLPTAIDHFMDLDSPDLTEKQKRDLYLTIANFVDRYCTDSPGYRDCTLYATKYYHRAYLLSKDSEDKKELNRKLAQFMIMQEDWEKAAATIEETQSYLMSPVERWRSGMLWAECQFQLGKESAALTELRKITEESDSEDIWAEALRTVADLLVSICEDDKRFERYRTATDNPDVTCESLKKQARGHYEQLVKELTVLHREHHRAQAGLLRLVASNNEVDLAYDTVNAVIASSIPRQYKLAALQELADMESRAGNVDAAASLLLEVFERFNINDVPARSLEKLASTFGRLGRWRQLFGILEKSTAEAENCEICMEILRNFYPRDNGLLQHLNLADTKNGLLERSQNVVHALSRVKSGFCPELDDSVLFVNAVLNFHAEAYEAAEKQFAQYLQNSVYHYHDEDVHYLNLVAALRLKRDPTVLALRANLYLQKFPDGAHIDEAIVTTLSAHYEMGLYEAALEIAKRSFIKEVASMGEENAPTSDVQWITAVANIGQCYANLGFHEKANQIFRTYRNELLSIPQGVTAYINWIQVAVKNGQYFEAVRRYDVAVPRIADPVENMKVQVDRDILALAHNYPKAYDQGQTTLRNLIANTDMDPTVKAMQMRRLYEAFLAQAMVRNPRRADALLAAVRKSFREQDWVDYWVLQSLTNVYETQDLNELRRAHEDVLEDAAANGDPEADRFIRDQIKLIDSLITAGKRVEKLGERGLM